MYDPYYYCEDCGKKIGLMSHDILDRLGESYYKCRQCEHCANTQSDDFDDSDTDYDPADLYEE